MVKAPRLQYLDWVRGLAAIVMLQGHVFHSFLKNDSREGGIYLFSQFLGGMPPAIFLFLTGITFAFLMDSRERQNVPPAARVSTALRRSGFLFLIAFLFRLQLWLFALIFSAGSSPWTDIFRVDILNCMGFAMAVLSPMALFKTEERVRLCAVLGVAIALASPLVSQIEWSGVPWIVKGYLAPDHLFFGFFPWAAFLAFGISAGSLFRAVRDEQMNQVMQWAALAGIVLAFGGHELANLGYSVYSKSDFWLDSPSLIYIKSGVILLMVSFAFLWTRQSASWSWVRQFGVTSLLVYWVHIELVYGHWLGAWKENLTVGQTLIAAVGIIGLMLLLSLARTHYKNWRGVLTSLGFFTPSVRRASGD